MNRRAPATMTLIALIVLAFGAETFLGVPLRDLGANIPIRYLQMTGQWWRLVTAMFLHADGVHLAVNLISLYQLGRYYEIMFGTRRFLLVYFVSGLAASVASTLYNDGYSVGASGAILGILGAFIFSIRRSPRWRQDPVGRSLVTQGTFWILANLVITFMMPQIDKAGHIGGLVSGLLLGGLLPQQPEPPPPPAQVVIDVRPYEGPGADPEGRRDDR